LDVSSSKHDLNRLIDVDNAQQCSAVTAWFGFSSS